MAPTRRKPAKSTILDTSLSSTLQEMLRNRHRTEVLEAMNTHGPAPSHHNSRAEPLAILTPPSSPPLHQEPGSPGSPPAAAARFQPSPPNGGGGSGGNGDGDGDDEVLRSFRRHDRAWWRRWPPRHCTDVLELPSSIGTARRSVRPEKRAPPRPALVSGGPSSFAAGILRRGIDQIELDERQRAQQVDMLLALTGECLLQQQRDRGMATLVDTTRYYPLLKVATAKTDTDFAMCALYKQAGWCVRGIACPFVHSRVRPRENFRRLVLKLQARVRWAHTFAVPVWPPRFATPFLPIAADFQWDEVQARFLPQWVLEMPRGGSHGAFAVHLARELRQHGGHLKRFELRKCPLVIATIAPLCQALCVCRFLRELCLAYCDITDETILPVSEFVDAHQTLTTLELRFNNLGPRGVGSLATAAASCSSLRYLSLHGNPIGDVGAAHLAKLMMLHTSLRHLDVSSAMIGDEGYSVLAQAISRNRSLLSLGLDGTFPTLTGCLSLFQALKLNKTLQQVSLRCIKATTRCFLDNIVRLMKENANERRRLLRKNRPRVGSPEETDHAVSVNSGLHDLLQASLNPKPGESPSLSFLS